MGTDVLSDVLRAVRLTGATYFTFDLSSPWVAEAPPARDLAPIVMPRAQRVIEYHVISGGGCWGGLTGEPPVKLAEGDVLVFPQGDPHVMSSAPGMRAPVDMQVFERPRGTSLPIMHAMGGGGPERTGVICGFLGLDERPYNPLLASLPRMIHLGGGAAARDGWLGHLIECTVEESKQRRAGADNVLSRLSELMFVEVVRRYIDSLPVEQTGWLAGLRDEYVGNALGLIHARAAHAWTIEDLAREVGLSRSALADRFTRFVGQPPMQYLANWRMQLAAGLLSSGNPNVAAVAYEVGYESEAAFSRAFKKLVGVPPATWRRSAATPARSG